MLSKAAVIAAGMFPLSAEVSADAMQSSIHIPSPLDARLRMLLVLRRAISGIHCLLLAPPTRTAAQRQQTPSPTNTVPGTTGRSPA